MDLKMADTRSSDDVDWSVTTWEGNRRAQLRQWCKLSLRERLDALDTMHDLAETFANARAEGRLESSPAESLPPGSTANDK